MKSQTHKKTNVYVNRPRCSFLQTRVRGRCFLMLRLVSYYRTTSIFSLLSCNVIAWTMNSQKGYVSIWIHDVPDASSWQSIKSKVITRMQCAACMRKWGQGFYSRNTRWLFLISLKAGGHFRNGRRSKFDYDSTTYVFYLESRFSCIPCGRKSLLWNSKKKDAIEKERERKTR